MFPSFDKIPWNNENLSDSIEKYLEIIKEYIEDSWQEYIKPFYLLSETARCIVQRLKTEEFSCDSIQLFLLDGEEKGLMIILERQDLEVNYKLISNEKIEIYVTIHKPFSQLLGNVDIDEVLEDSFEGIFYDVPTVVNITKDYIITRTFLGI